MKPPIIFPWSDANNLWRQTGDNEAAAGIGVSGMRNLNTFGLVAYKHRAENGDPFGYVEFLNLIR